MPGRTLNVQLSTSNFEVGTGASLRGCRAVRLGPVKRAARAAPIDEKKWDYRGRCSRNRDSLDFGLQNHDIIGTERRRPNNR